MPSIPFFNVSNGIESTDKFSTAIMAHFFRPVCVNKSFTEPRYATDLFP